MAWDSKVKQKDGSVVSRKVNKKEQTEAAPDEQVITQSYYW